MVQYISGVGLVIQEVSQEGSSYWQDVSTYGFTVSCIAIAFYLFSIVVAFFAYREFKGLVHDAMGGGG